MQGSNPTEDDAIADALQATSSLEDKQACMRYRKLKQETMASNPAVAQTVLGDSMVQVRKQGVLWKKGVGVFGHWQTRYFVLSSMGLVYFKQEEMKKNVLEYEPQGWKPISDFVITVETDVSVIA